MKLNLLLNNRAGIIGGYTNIDPFADGSDERVPGDVSNLKEIDDYEVDEILADSIHEYFPYPNLLGLINNWITKLVKGGKLVIKGNDINLLTFKRYSGEISEEQYIQEVYGNQKETWDFKKCMAHIAIVAAILESKNVKILKKYYENYKFVVVGEKS